MTVDRETVRAAIFGVLWSESIPSDEIASMSHRLTDAVMAVVALGGDSRMKFRCGTCGWEGHHLGVHEKVRDEWCYGPTYAVSS